MTNAVTLASIANSGYLRNRIINGNMMIDQRNSGASASAGAYTLDRWYCDQSAASKYTVQQNSGSVTPPAGFKNYLGAVSSSAYSLGAGDYFTIQQYIEGLNVADLGWGTANAQTVTLSFWVRSSLTGTFGGSLKNSAENRSYPFTYTISSASTWEYKTITIPGDTTGTWLTTNGKGISLFFGIGVGTTYSGPAGAWAATNYASATGATSVVGTNGATWYVTGVQLEVGTQATPDEWRLISQELAMCYRYYRRYISSGNTYTALGSGLTQGASSISRWGFQLDIPMRAAPTLAIVNSVGWNGPIGGAITAIANISSPNIVDTDLSTSGLTNSVGLIAKILILSNGYMEVSAEL